MAPPLRVLLLASDARLSLDVLALDHEARVVTDAIRGTRGRAVDLQTEWAVSVGNLQPLLLWHRPEVVHFSGHGKHARGLLFTDPAEGERNVDAETLRELFSILNGFVRGVVLNACETLPVAAALAEVVDFAVGMAQPISDQAAAAFAAAFYGALSSEATVNDAFALAVNRLRMDFPDERDTPRLLLREGMDGDAPLARAPFPTAPGRAGDGGAMRLHEVVRLAATCFPGLSVATFDQAVRALLGDGRPELGGDRRPDKTEARLLRSWREEPERVLRESGVAVGTVPPGHTAVGVAGSGGRPRLRELLRGAEAFRFHAFLRDVHRAGLPLHPSPALSGAATRLAVDVAAADPGAYGGDWLLDLLSRARGERGAAPPEAITRFAYLLRGFYTHPALAPAADAAFDTLVRTGAHAEALALAERLLFEPAFDTHAWLRRLADGGDERTRAALGDLLLRELAAVGSDLYTVLEPVSRWLPEAHRPPAAFTASQRLALRLLPDFAVATAKVFPVAYHGQWPVTYPLLAARDRESAEGHARLLVAWLFHPGLSFGAGAGEVDRVRAMLVAEWAFIVGAAPAGHDASAAALAPGDMLASILREMVRQTGTVTGERTRRAVLAYWRDMKDAYAEFLRIGAPRGDVRRDLVRRRDLVQALITHLRALQQRARAGGG